MSRFPPPSLKFGVFPVFSSLDLSFFPSSPVFLTGSCDFSLVSVRPLSVFSLSRSSGGYFLSSVFLNGISCEFFLGAPDFSQKIAEARDARLLEALNEEKAAAREAGEYFIVPPEEIPTGTAFSLRLSFFLPRPLVSIFGPQPLTISPESPPFSFCTPGRFSPSLIFPCFDSSSLVCPHRWSFDFPSFLSVASGGRAVGLETSGGRTREKFESPGPITPQAIGFLIGNRLQKVRLRPEEPALFAVLDGSEEFPKDFLAASSAGLVTMIDQIEDFMQEIFPLPSLTIIFSDRAYFKAAPFCGLALLQTSAGAFSPREIDRVYSALPLQALTVAESWLRYSVRLDSPSDVWLVHGFSHILCDFFLSRSFGRNWLEFHNAVKTREILAESAKKKIPARPLCWQGFLSEFELETRLAHWRAGAVMRMIQRRLGGQFHALLQAALQEGADCLSTKKFQELAILQDSEAAPIFRWLHDERPAEVRVSYEFSQKRRTVAVKVESQPPVPGILTLVIHEAERVSRQERRIGEAPSEFFEFPCQSKAKLHKRRRPSWTRSRGR